MHAVNGWSHNLGNMLQMFVGQEVQLCEEEHLLPVNKKAVLFSVTTSLEALESSKHEQILFHTQNHHGSAVRACPNHIRDGFKSFKYMRWFRDDNDCLPTVSFVHEVRDIRTLAKFRCGMHWLATETNRSNNLGRSDRICACCSSGEREDEIHIFFCEAYAQLREMFPVVFASKLYLDLQTAYLNNDDGLDEYMRIFMNRKDNVYINDLAGFLQRSIKVRERCLCV
jgi:hypothetical protein